MPARPAGQKTLTVTLDTDTAALFTRLAGSTRAYGAFLTRLLREEDQRQTFCWEERIARTLERIESHLYRPKPDTVTQARTDDYANSVFANPSIKERS